MKVLWVITALSAVLGAFVFLLSIGMNGGVGQAAGFAASAALAVVPYVFTRCVQAINEPTPADLTRAVVHAIEKRG